MSYLRKIALFILFISLTALHPSYAQTIRTIAGCGTFNDSAIGGPAILAGISKPYSVVVNDSGEVFFTDNYFSNLFKVSPRGIITVYAGRGYPGLSGDGGPSTAASINSPFGITRDTADNIVFADAGYQRIRSIKRDTIRTIAGIGGPGVSGYFSGDGIPAVSAKTGACGVAYDRYNNLYIADGNARVRKVNANTGLISTIAGSGAVGYAGNGGQATAATLEGVTGVCVDTAGNIYVCENVNNVIRKVNTSGIISLYAGTTTAGYSGDGGQATSAKLNGPNSVRIDPQGNVVIVDQNNSRIRRVSPTGIITTIAGNGTSGYSGDGGVPTSAAIHFPADVCWDNYGNMYIADKGTNTGVTGHRIRQVFTVDTMHVAVSPNDTICGFDTVTYRVVERTPHYNCKYIWRKNGVIVGYNQPTYVSDSVRIYDNITCTIKDTANGGITLAVSDTLHMIVRPVVVPSIYLSSSTDTICDGQAITYTAHYTNGGLYPTFRWWKASAGTLAGPSLSPSFLYAPSAGDIIKCTMNSDAICAFPDTIIAGITVVVNTSYRPDITLRASPKDTIDFWGQVITLFSNLTYEGTAPTFQWYLNGAPIPGATNASYSQEVYWNDTLYCVMHSNAYCVVPEIDTSNVIILSVGKLGINTLWADHSSFSVIPNPSNGTFILEGNLNDKNIASSTLSVTDICGKVVYNTNIELRDGRISEKVTLPPGLPDGLYLLNLVNEKGSYVLRTVIKH